MATSTYNMLTAGTLDLQKSSLKSGWH